MCSLCLTTFVRTHAADIFAEMVTLEKLRRPPLYVLDGSGQIVETRPDPRDSDLEKSIAFLKESYDAFVAHVKKDFEGKICKHEC